MEKVKVLISTTKLRKKVAELAREISKDYRGKDLVLIGILKGAFVFLSDLVRNLTIPVSIDFIQVASYGASTTSSGVIKIKKDIDLPIVDKEVLIVEDIVDYGYTMDYLLKFIGNKKPKRVKICALLDKPSRRRVEVPIDYKGFVVPDKFVVGYGLDFNEKYRNLPYVGYLSSPGPF
ncbi:MAG: hypoxanthine phosphoribosyltransferase [Candidatus Margulisiibacteriota bacterium]